MKKFISKPYNLIFYFLTILTGSLEISGLYSVLGWEVTIAIAIVVSFTKSLMLLGRHKALFLVLIISVFFSVQKPFLRIINKLDNDGKIEFIKENIKRTQNEYTYLMEEYTSSKRVYDKAQKDGAWGVLKDYDKTDRLGGLRSEMSSLKKEISEWESKLLDLNKEIGNKYKDFLRILVIIASEILLYISASRFVRKQGRPFYSKNKKKYVKKDEDRVKRKYTRKISGDVVNIQSV